MSLTELWLTTPKQVREKNVQQIISFAGDGKLRDAGKASEEFRELLAQIDHAVLRRYADECLIGKFDDSGLALQDVVNEVGRRLGYSVTHGRYRGIAKEIGFDGLWRSSLGHNIVIEVKTTDAYRIDLETLSRYRYELIERGIIVADRSSILIVVGRQDTGDLEAQIRGSKHAWDIRLISVEALMRLLAVRIEVDDPRIETQIGELLLPHEYTRVDGIINLVFATTAEVGEAVEQTDLEKPTRSTKRVDTDRSVAVSFHDACVTKVADFLKKEFIRRSRVLFASTDGSTLLNCVVSKEYGEGNAKNYWYAFHPHQRERLREAANALVAFGCGSPERVILIPFKTFEPWLSGMNITQQDDRQYWHVQIFFDGKSFSLHRRRTEPRVDLSPFLLSSGH